MKLRSQVFLFLLLLGLTPLLVSVAINIPLVLDRIELFYHKAYLQKLRADFRDLDQHITRRQEMVRLSGNYMTKVFEGPYKNAPQWEKEMQAYVRSKGKQPGKVYFFYTTCPKCAKAYGKNYVVGIAEVMPGE